jgi:HAD superfamily hydrolase (TIGR01490 family)
MPDKLPELVIYDFCETLVSIQTADTFVNFICNFTNRGNFISFFEIFFKRIRLLFFFNLIFPKLNFSKKLCLYKLKGLSADELAFYTEKFYQEVIKKNYNKLIIEKLISDVEQDNIVVIISGGYQPYIEKFCNEFNVKYLLCNKLQIKNGYLSGFLEGKDCMFNEKVLQLNTLIKNEELQYSNSKVYSDSITDMPLFKWAAIQCVVSYNKSQQWPIIHGFKEIILKKDA